MDREINNNIFGLAQILFRYLENVGKALILLAQVFRSLELLTLTNVIRMPDARQRRTTRFFRSVARIATRRAASIQNQENVNQEWNNVGWVQRGPGEEIVRLRNREENEELIDVERIFFINAKLVRNVM